MPHDCVAHLRQAHAVPHIVRAANLGNGFPSGQFPGRHGARPYYHMFLE